MIAVSLLCKRLQVSINDQPTEISGACRRLASYLCTFSGKAHCREQLSERFWPELAEHDPEKARAALNTALWRLRKVFSPHAEGRKPACIRTVGADVILEPSQDLIIDTRVFGDLANAAREQMASPAADLAMTRAEPAVRAYGGAFLEDEDGDWVLEERERLHTLFVRVSGPLIRAYGRAGRYEDAIELARQILAADPYREGTLRDLLILLVLNDERPKALRFYEDWAQRLREDLGIEPMQPTVAVVGSIRTGSCLEQLRRHFLDPGA
jgi:pentatricopeptide repeat protein